MACYHLALGLYLGRNGLPIPTLHAYSYLGIPAVVGEVKPLRASLPPRSSTEVHQERTALQHRDFVVPEIRPAEAHLRRACERALRDGSKLREARRPFVVPARRSP